MPANLVPVTTYLPEDDEQGPQCCKPLHKLSHPSEMVRQFTPNWFAATMGTGIVALQIHNFPYKFPGQQELVLAFWSLNVGLFTFFSILFCARFMIYPWSFAYLMRHAQSFFLGTIPMGFATILNGTIILFPQIPQLAHTLFWIDTFLAVVSGFLVPWYMAIHQTHALEKMTAIWLLPIVPAGVTAASGGLLAPLLPVSQARIVIMTGYFLWTLSIPLAMGILYILFLRLALYKLPPNDMIVSLLLPLGPLGTGALALINLGNASNAVFLNPDNGFSPAVQKFASAADSFGLILAFILWGYGVWWFLASFSFLCYAFPKGVPFNLGWWAFTFPLGVFTAGQLALAQSLEYEPLEWFGAGLVGLLVLLWLMVASKTILGAWAGELFHAPELANMNNSSSSKT